MGWGWDGMGWDTRGMDSSLSLSIPIKVYRSCTYCIYAESLRNLFQSLVGQTPFQVLFP